MKTKYPMPKPHVHAELIKAFADGAKIEQKSKYDNFWEISLRPLWVDNNMEFRIEPYQPYTLAKIAELGGDCMVELYLYWLNGGEIEYATGKDNQIWLSFSNVSKTNDPYKNFEYLTLNHKFTSRKKKRMVKQVLWIVTYEHPNIVKDCFFLNEDVEPKSFPEGYTEHKVPSCTREVESDD